MLFSSFNSDTMKRNLSDWILAAVLVVYFLLVAEQAKPFNRQFSLADQNIQHPFAEVERVSGIQCLFLAFFVPFITINLVTLYLKVKHNKTQNEHFYLLQISTLGLLLAISIDGVFTDILKNWIARPRPDFLARCAPVKGTDPYELVGIEVCSAPYGQRILTDGMRSTPSGHASISFSGLLYLTLWLCGQFKVTETKTPVYRVLLAVLPIIGALYISLSRTQDYRHHFSDIVIGGSIGISIALGIYHKYFPSIFSENPEKPLIPNELDTVLPMYSRTNSQTT